MVKFSVYLNRHVIVMFMSGQNIEKKKKKKKKKMLAAICAAGSGLNIDNCKNTPDL